MPIETYRIIVGEVGLDSDSERERLTADLEERIMTSGVDIISLRRVSERPGETMAVGTILDVQLGERIGRSLLDAIRSWLASRRTEIELQTPDGRKVKVSAANFEEAVQLLEVVHRT